MTRWLLALGLGGAGGVYLVENEAALENALTDTLPAVRDMADSAAGLASIGVPPGIMLAIVAVMFIGRPAMGILDKLVSHWLETKKASKETES